MSVRSILSQVTTLHAPVKRVTAICPRLGKFQTLLHRYGLGLGLGLGEFQTLLHRLGLGLGKFQTLLHR